MNLYQEVEQNTPLQRTVTEKAKGKMDFGDKNLNSSFTTGKLNRRMYKLRVRTVSRGAVSKMGADFF